MSRGRRRANVLVIGTPGTGKTTLCMAAEERLGDGYKHIEVGKEISKHQLFDEFDESRGCTVFNDDKVYEHIDGLIKDTPDGGLLVDFHAVSCLDVSKESFDVILLLRASTENIFDRLTGRGYTQRKIEENVQCEIFEIVKHDLIDEDPDYNWDPIPPNEIQRDEIKNRLKNGEQIHLERFHNDSCDTEKILSLFDVIASSLH